MGVPLRQLLYSSHFIRATSCGPNKGSIQPHYTCTCPDLASADIALLSATLLGDVVCNTAPRQPPTRLFRGKHGSRHLASCGRACYGIATHTEQLALDVSDLEPLHAGFQQPPIFRRILVAKEPLCRRQLLMRNVLHVLPPTRKLGTHDSVRRCMSP